MKRARDFPGPSIGLVSRGGRGLFLFVVFDYYWSLEKENLGLRSEALCDHVLPSVGIKTLGSFSAFPEVNSSSGLIISVQIIFSDEPRDAAIVWGGLLEHCLCIVASDALWERKAN